MGVFPTVDAFLASLPDGIDAHPTCESKVSLIRDRIARYASAIEPADALPARIRDLFRDPPPSTAWISTVAWQCVSLAIRDAAFEPGLSGEHAFLAMLREENARLFRSPLYRALLVVVSPKQLLRGASRRFGTFHRGVTLEARDERGARPTFVVELRFPPRLYHALTLRAIVNGMAVAVEAAGGEKVAIDELVRQDDRATVALSWS